MGLIGAALGAAGSIFGGIAASKAIKKQKAMVQQQMKENQDWYDRWYNEDSTQRADAQALLTQTEENIKNRNKQAAGAQAVMGGTDESVAAAKAANNQALAQTMSNINVQGEQRKAAIEDRYLDTKAGLNDKLQNIEGQKAKAIGQAVQGVAGTAGNMDFGDVKIGKHTVGL